jgi:hypothetical protein
MIHECRNPVPCTTPLGDGYVWYIQPGGLLENDCYAVILLDGGKIKHFTSDQVTVWHNETYGIKKNEFKF